MLMVGSGIILGVDLKTEDLNEDERKGEGTSRGMRSN